MRFLAGLALLLAAPVAHAESPPPVIVRPVPPGMESYAQPNPAAHAPTTASDHRRGFTLRVSLGAGTFAVADEDGVEVTSAATFALALGGFVSRSFALYGHVESSEGDPDHLINDLELVGVAADWFLTDRWVIGGALGRAKTGDAGRTPDGREEDQRGVGAHGRIGYVAWQRRKHALDITAAVSAGWFEDNQVQTVGLHVGYRFF